MSNVCRLIVVSLFIQTPLVAQVSLDAVARDVKQGQKVRVHSSAGLMEGRYAGYTNNPAMIRLRVGDNIVPVGMIDSLWVHHSNVKTFAIIGGLVTAAGATAGWVWICGSDDDGCDVNATMIGGTAAVVGIGAFIGGLLGAAASGWDLRYSTASVSLRTTPLPQRRVGVGVSIPVSFGRPFLRR